MMMTDLEKFRAGEEFDVMQAVLEEIKAINALEEALTEAKAELKMLMTVAG